MPAKNEWRSSLSQLFDQALEMDDLQRAEWLTQLDENDREAAGQVRAFSGHSRSSWLAATRHSGS